MFKIVLDMPVPAELESATEDSEEISERDRKMIWKVKGAAARLTFRLFSRYANTNYCIKEEEIAYKTYF